MRKFLITAAFVMMAGPLMAQGGGEGQMPPMTPDRISTITTYLRTSTAPSVNIPDVANMSSGTGLNENVELRSFPPNMNLSMLRYVRSGNRVLIVNPTNRRVVQVINM